MFEFELSVLLQKKLKKLYRKNPTLAYIFRKKAEEIIMHDERSIDTYKNLRSPKNNLKRVHLTNQFVLLFTVDKAKNFILFVDVVHRKFAY